MTLLSRVSGVVVLGLIAVSGALGQAAPATAPQPPAAAAHAKTAKVYDEQADARKDIAAALARAKRDQTRVLIQWGGNWCPWCLRLHDLCQRDDSLKHELLYEYEIVHVDAGRNNKNLDLAREYHAPVEKDGFPYLTILDADGKLIANQETGSLELKDAKGESVLGEGAGHDPAKVLTFLRDHQAHPDAAPDVLAAGLSRAKASHLRAFVHFGAPWCGWCHKLEAWMSRDDVAPLLAKEFVDIKIDIERMPGGQEVFAKYNPAGQSSGIPWFVILDEDGKVLADSSRDNGGKKENIGFPSAPEELDHFRQMLRTSASHLSSDEISNLIETLKAPPGAAH